MRNITFGLALLGVLTLTGCPKSSSGGVEYDEEALATNPAANFHKGMSVINSPDKKTGEVDYSSAYAYFAKSADLGGGAKAAFNAGWIAERLGMMDKSVDHYKAAFEADATYEAAAFSLARVLTEQGDHEQASNIYKTKADASPSDLSARNEYMAALVRSGRFDEAILQAQAILRQDSKNAETYRNLSALYYAQDNYSMSQLTAEKALELDDSDPGVYNNMGITYLIQGNEPAALEKFKTAIKLNSGHYEANMNLGYSALNSGDYVLALTSFEAAIGTNPSSLDAKLGLAVSSRGTGDTKRAGQLYDEIIQNAPGTEEAYFNASVLHEFYTLDFKKASEYLQAYIDSHNVGPTHEVYGLMQRINEARAAEDEKKRIEAERIAAEKERERRNEELLGTIAAKVAKTEQTLVTYAECIDEDSIEEVMMVLDQAMMVVEMEEADMAPDVDNLLDAYITAVDGAIEGCEPTAPSEEEAAPGEGEAAEGEAAEGEAAEGEAAAEGDTGEDPAEEPAEGDPAEAAPADGEAAEETPIEEAPAEGAE
jgi:tetratricopeptide (TPR) repeat protein